MDDQTTYIQSPHRENQESDALARSDSLLDGAVLAEWQDMTGAGYPAFLARMVQQFVKDAGQCVQQVQRAVEGGDMAKLVEVAHGLKGISGNMGARHLVELSLALEQCGRNQILENLEDLSHSLQQAFQQVQEELIKETEKQSLS